MKRLAGKSAIVTGAAQGIGKAAAIRLAREGAYVALVDRVKPACEDVVNEITAAGGEAFAVTADMETKSGIDTMMEQALTVFKALDISVHNVGGTIWTKPFWEFSDEQMQTEINRSLWPTLRCCRAVGETMMRQKRGSIINIGSVATRGINRLPYSVAKGGVHAMTITLAMELAEYNTRVNCVVPGAISANRVIPRSNEPRSQQEQDWHKEVIDQSLRDTFLSRLGQAGEVANAIAFLASDESSYITGELLHVSGGGIS